MSKEEQRERGERWRALLHSVGPEISLELPSENLRFPSPRQRTLFPPSTAGGVTSVLVLFATIFQKRSRWALPSQCLGLRRRWGLRIPSFFSKS